MLEAPWSCAILCFLLQIVTEYINAMFLLVSNFKMIGMLLNVVHGQVPETELTKTYNKEGFLAS